MTEMTDEAVKALLDGATPGRRVQFHGSYCPEAVGTPFTDWDTSHEMSVIRPDGSRYRLAHYKHASDAYLSQMAPDLARALLAARAIINGKTFTVDEAQEAIAQARADTEAAVALALEEAAAEQDRRVEYWTRQLEAPGIKKSSVGATQGRIAGHYSAAEAIRALAPASGVAKLAALRAERDEAVSTLAYCEKQWSESDRVTHAKMLGERARADNLAAENQRLRDRERVLREAVTDYHLALDRRENGNTAGYRLQDAIQHILEMPWRQGAALAKDAEKAGGV